MNTSNLHRSNRTSLTFSALLQSFTKHTFQCVNGTVFNQRSFTCTRYEDSIPCESSSSYFYLNKRNGDPKAYFLTDEDMVKANNEVTPNPSRAPQIDNSKRSADFQDDIQTNNFGNDQPEYSSNYRPNSNFGEHNDKTYGKVYSSKIATSKSSEFIPDQDKQEYTSSPTTKMDKLYSAKPSFVRVSPYRSMIPKYNMPKSGVKYSPKSKPIKYESFNTRTTSEYPASLNHQSFSSFAMPSSPKQGSSKANSYLSKYESLLNSSKQKTHDFPKKSYTQQPKTFNFKTLPDSYYSPSQSYDESSSITQVNQPKRQASMISSTSKSNEFTPATFSKMYVENAERFSQTMPKIISESPQKINYYDSRIVTPKTKASKPVHNKSSYTPFSLPHRQESISSSAHKPSSISMFKSDIPEENVINSRQYVVPSSVRIIPPNELQNDAHSPPPPTNKEDSHHHHHYHRLEQTSPDYQTTDRPSTRPPSLPLRMTFSTKNQPQLSDYNDENYRVVKEVKGKSLLIDPTLDKDPARDNIIAQVLEMLNKYKR